MRGFGLLPESLGACSRGIAANEKTPALANGGFLSGLF